jgi:teichoic acid transport system permease protein
MKKFFTNIKKYYRYAIRSAKAELKSEVADSYLNWLWWIIEPFCFMLIYTFIFGFVFKNHTPYFASFVFIGLTAWEFFNRMINGSVKLIINNRDLVTKVYIPKYILLLSKSFTYVFKMGISLLITFALMIFQHVPFTFNILFLIPIFIILYLFSFGIGMILMHYGVTLNDLANLTHIVLRMVFYLSGIFYNINERLHGNLKFLLLRANPVAFLMHQLRNVMLYGKLPSFEGLAIWFGISIVLCIVGIRIIHKNENSYAKVI